MPNINYQLGSYSELFMALAGITYVVAFIAFAWDMISQSKAVNQGLAQVPAATAVPVAAGAMSAAVHGGGGSYRSQVSGLADRRLDSNSTVTTRSFRYGSDRKPWARVGVALTILGFVIQAVAVVSRAIAAERVPWGNMYEFCTTGALVVTGVFLLSLIKFDLRFVGTFVMALVVTMLTAAVVVFPTPVAPLVPALQSPWLVIHVSVAVLASSLFALAFALSVLQMIQLHFETRTAKTGQGVRGFFKQVPSAVSLENLAYRISALAFVLWTFTLIAGALWAQKAWGRYWGWDTKEVWTFVIWVIYAGYLHARATRGWTGARAAWLNIVGFAAVVFNFSVVNIFFSGLHSYSGVGTS